MSEAAAATDDPGLIHRLLERLGVHFSSGVYADEAAAARAEYFTATGELHEEDRDLFEPRMEAFLEWYVLERPLPTGRTPVAGYLDNDAQAAPTDEREALARLCRTRRSLFTISKVKDGKITLEDLASKERLVAHERRGTVGFTAKDLCEARLCPSDDGWVFTKTLLFHPRDASKAILAGVKEALKNQQPLGDLAFRLARLHQRWHRLGHAAADRIYRDGLARDTLTQTPAVRGKSLKKPGS
ncbi:MAG TPA: hypothetical protein VGF45_15845 [Polyangia bacterium]